MFPGQSSIGERTVLGDGTHGSWLLDRITPSLLMYSVLRSHGTWARGVAGPFAPDDPFAYCPEELVGSRRRSASLRSSRGRLSGSGFNA